MSHPFDERRAQAYLDRFDQDPKAAMSELPEKTDAAGQIIEHPRSAFAEADVADRSYILHRDGIRRNLRMVVDGTVISLANAIPGRAPIEDIDRPEHLVDTLRYLTPSEMEAAGLLKAKLEEPPWSDDYWGLYLGCLGRRYADPHFPNSEDWEENAEYVREQPAAALLQGGGAAVDLLSPSEKFDALIGTAGALTAGMWQQGRWYHEQSGKVETWMGICHGWAPASYMLPRPSGSVAALAADGKTHLCFYPADIKALASLLWANAQTVTRFIGGRCTDKKPRTDENGRAISSTCFDTNPGTWHLSVVNQLGGARRSLVMDATYDYEVWNQPLHSYEYRYFNPQTMKLVRTLAEATVPAAAFTKDRFRKYRGQKVAAYVGIVMTVCYVAETRPSHRATDSAKQDAVQTVTYKYDLELDKDGKILGGEWYTGKGHPDFLWTPPPKARAQSPAEQLATGSWDPARVMPASWRKAAARAAERGLPMAKIVERLIHLANAG